MISRCLFTEFTNNDFLRLWKGLYYCMWMSDKPLVQEELAEDLGSLIHCFPDIKVGIQFFRNFLETMCLEWFGIDQWRIDKFMMVSLVFHCSHRRVMTLTTLRSLHLGMMSARDKFSFAAVFSF